MVLEGFNEQAGVNPDSLKMWAGYLQSAKKLNSVPMSEGMEGVNFVASEQSHDLWYSYLWMLEDKY